MSMYTNQKISKGRTRVREGKGVIPPLPSNISNPKIFGSKLDLTLLPNFGVPQAKAFEIQ